KANDDIDRECRIAGFPVNMEDAPGVHYDPNKATDGAPAVAQKISFTTWLALMRNDLSLGTVLVTWNWTANFVYFVRPADQINIVRGGLALPQAGVRQITGAMPAISVKPRALDRLARAQRMTGVSKGLSVQQVKDECTNYAL